MKKEIREAIDFGGFNFARENLSILDNLQRAHASIKNDPALKDNKDLNKFLKNIEIREKDLLSIFKKNKIEKIDAKNKKFDPNFHQAMAEIENPKVDQGILFKKYRQDTCLETDFLGHPWLLFQKKCKKRHKN